MTNIKATKRALGSSVLALFLCFAMLLGSTYAWFTDSVTSANNIITAGNLDVELYWSTNATDWKEVSDGTNVFEDVDYWEPGKTQVVYLKVVNAGTLALKYKLGINIASETISTNINNEKLQLSEHIMYGITPCTAAYANSVAAIAAVNTDEIQAKNLTNVYAGEFADLYPKANTESKASEQMLAMVVYMPETVGNEANHMQGAPVPEIKLGINLFATQTTVENDSFDDKYDADADKMYTVNGVKYNSADEALAAANDGDKVYLSSVTKPITIEENIELTLENTYIVADSGENAITVNAASATIIFKGYNMVVGGMGANGIYVGSPANVPGTSPVDAVENAYSYGVTLSGDGTLIAKGNGGVEKEKDTNGGSGIYGDVNSTLVIKDLKTVIAEGYGKDGFGIGGTTKSITIENSNIDYAKGGFVQPELKYDLKYGKEEPEGGAAIGSMSDGAVINIIGSTIKRADGGSKAAGIGARFWTGVTVNITDSTVTAQGGNASAGIGGSRVSGGATESGTTINITNSKINAVGGAYGAGIGSGYDTHCGKNQPLCTINIKDSEIFATGGQYAAGIGTGYHNAALVGEIVGGEVTAVSGDKFYKDSYTKAQDIGFGVVDPAREAENNASYIKYEGKTIFIGDEETEPTYELIADGLIKDKNDCFYVLNANGLKAVADIVNATTPYTDTIFDGKYVKLVRDIDLGGMEWIPIGDDRSQRTEFHGIFDGQGHTISNVTITKKTDRDDENKSSYGLFGNVKGTIKNLTVDNVNISGTPKFIGALVGRLNDGLIENCHVTNSKVTCNNWTIGGLVGQFNNGKISGCSVTNTTIEGYAAVGGIVGIALNAGERTIENCTVENCQIAKNGSFGGDYDKMFGAIVGAVYSGSLTVKLNECKAIGNNINMLCGYLAEGDKLIVDGAVFVTTANELQTALDNATENTTIVFGADITGNVKVTQNENIDLVIDGNDYKYTGVMTVFGNGRKATAALTIKNIDFVAATGVASCIVSPDRTVNNAYSYSSNVTVENCTFTDPDGVVNCAAVRHEDGGDSNWKIIDCVVDNTMHSILQVNNVEGKLTIADCKVYSKNGANLNSCTNVELTGCEFDVKGYTVRFGVNSGGNLGVEKNYVFTNNKLKSSCDDGDAVIMFRASAVDANVNLNETELIGATKFSGATKNTKIHIDGILVVTNNEDLKEAVENGVTKLYLTNGEYDLNENQKDGLTLIGLDEGVKMANTTKYASGKAIGAIWKAINLENVTITNTVYTMADGGNATFTNVNFAAGFRQGYGKSVVFNDCTFGSNSEGYALHFQTDSASEDGIIKLNGCEFEGGKVHLGGKRAYTFTGCDFAEGTDFQVWSNITLENCTVNGVSVTSENIATLFPNLNLEKVTIN